MLNKQDPFAQTEVEASAPGGLEVPSQAASDAEILDKCDESKNDQGEADLGGRSSDDIGYALYYLLDQVSCSSSSGLDEHEKQRLKDLLKREKTIHAARIIPEVYTLILNGQAQRMYDFARRKFCGTSSGTNAFTLPLHLTHAQAPMYGQASWTAKGGIPAWTPSWLPFRT